MPEHTYKIVTDWVIEQTNCPLHNEVEVIFAKTYLRDLGLPLHNDRWKNWDNAIAIHHATRHYEQDNQFLDAGGTRDPKYPSVFLPGLRKLGFDRLTSCNLDEGDLPVIEDGILYTKQNIEKTNFLDEYFDFIACLSVIEHGVDLNEYFREMTRILAPGGMLFTSFDYWPTYIYTRGMVAFGAPVRIFRKSEVESMIVFAAALGLEAVQPLKFDVEKPTVNWMGLDYTFFNLLLRKSR